MHIQQLKNEVDALKEEVEEIRTEGADKVLVSTLEELREATLDLHRRLTNLEIFLSKPPVEGRDFVMMPGDGKIEAGK